MKTNPILLAAIAAFALAGSANAAVVTWNPAVGITLTGVESTEKGQIYTEGTFGASYTNNGVPSTTSNGVSFPASTAITLVEGGANVGNYALSATTAFQTVIAGYHYKSDGGMTYTASGLTSGQQYAVQFFNYDGGSGAAVLSDGNGNNVNLDEQYVIGKFTADAATQVFTVTNTGRMNAAQIRTIPEPSAAALGLLATGGLLLRRRRA